MSSSYNVRQWFQSLAGFVVDRVRWVSLGLSLGIGVALAMLLWFSLHPWLSGGLALRTTADVRNLILGEVHHSTELVAAQSAGKATVVLRRQRTLFGLPLGDTNLVYEGVGRVRAGFDLSQLSVDEVDFNQHSIWLTLPAPTIREVSLDVEHSGTLANYRRWLAPKADIDLQEQAQREAIHTIQTEACANAILEEATASAEQVIRLILTGAGFETIHISTQATRDVGCPMA